MKLTQIALDAINENLNCKTQLALKFNKHPSTIWRWLEENEMDGKLTTFTAMNVIKKYTKLKDKEILTLN